MHVAPRHVLTLFSLLLQYENTNTQKPIQQGDQRGNTDPRGFRNVILNSDTSLGNKQQPFQQDFLKNHFKPSTFWDSHFNLKADPSYVFKPPIRVSPFRSSGEPWPKPREMKTISSEVYAVNTADFKIDVLNKTCDILEEAIKRTTELISQYTLEDPYYSVFRDNPLSEFESKKRDTLREAALPLRSISVYMSDADAGYPSVESDESYRLSVSKEGAKLVANQVWGAIRGLETLSQLFVRGKNDTLFIKGTAIYDYPRFSHRGILIDTSRHFIRVAVIKEVMEGMFQNKMNVLHWHIVDDNSFPYQSEVYPDLSKKGAYHPSMVYSLEDIKELIEFARLRGIRIIPEIDSPGHTFSWGLGYPGLKSKCSKTASQDIPVGPLDPSRNYTYNFMNRLFEEIFSVFKDKFVHLGGDELHSLCWAQNENIVNTLSELAGLERNIAKMDPSRYVNLAIGYYFKRLVRGLSEVAKTTRPNGSSFIMWEDVLKNTQEIPKDSILQVWYGRQSNVRILNQQGYRALYSSCWYLDHVKDAVQWVEYYQCEPSPYSTEEEEKGKLLGGEACLWAEYIVSENLMTTMWPRTLAIAERLWSSKGVRDVSDAGRRFQEQKCRMLYRGLPVGHGSGPDYCLRHKRRPSYLSESGGGTLRSSSMLTTDFHLLSQKTIQPWMTNLPVINLAISILGISVIVMASSCCRRRLLDVNWKVSLHRFHRKNTLS